VKPLMCLMFVFVNENERCGKEVEVEFMLRGGFFRKLSDLLLVPRLRWTCGTPVEPQPRKLGRLTRQI